MVLLKNKKAFTLVELIVVITILTILGTIAFLSMNGYSGKARDTLRVNDMKNISDGLSVFYTKTGNYPTPENYVTITGSGTVLRYQGVAGQNVLNFINLSGTKQGSGKDPKTGEYYTYIIDGNKGQHQIIGYYENMDTISYNNFLDKVSASYTGGFLKTMGGDLGIILENEKPVHEISSYVGTTIDIRNTTNTYKINYNQSDIVSGTGIKLFSSMYNRDPILLKNKDLAQLDDSLVGFWDMETKIMSGSQIVLKDFSKGKNNGSCYDNYGTMLNCSEGNGPKTELDYTVFDGNDYVQIDKNVYTDEMTMIARVQPKILDSSWHGFVGYQNYGSGNIRPFNLWVTPDWNHPNGGFHWDNNAIDAIELNEAGKRCAGDNEYIYDPNEQEKRDFFAVYRRKPPYVDLSVNGKNLMNTQCAFSIFYKAPAFWIGRVDNFFVGNIYEVRIYNRYLSNSEVSSIFSSNVN